MKMVTITHYLHLNTAKGGEQMVYRGSLESHVRAGRLSEKDARNIAKLLQIDFDLNKKNSLVEKNISQKLRG